VVLLLFIGHCNGKFNVGVDASFAEVAGSKLSSCISLDLSDIDVFNSDRVI
jgi:hypothetical protein